MHSIIAIRAAALLTALFLSLPGLAQTLDLDVLVDTDSNAASGCSVTPSGGAALSGFERRVRASVDLGSFEVIAIEQSSCDGASFGAAAPVSGFATPYPLALNTGIGGADAVELAVARTALGAANLSQLRLAFVADNGTGSDVLATTDGSAGGGPIVFGLPVQIPALSIWGLGALVLVLLTLAWMAHRRMGRVGAVMAVMLVTTAAWAMTFALDGDLSDWGGRAPNAIDPGGDATDGSAAIDLLAVFVVLDGDDLFFRVDVSDTENQAPVAGDDAFATDEDTTLNVAAPGVLGNDIDAELDPITAVLDAGPANAQDFTLNTDGSFDYTPNADFNGSDSFTYFANDGQADSNAATVTITINPINDPPVAVDDTATTDEDQQIDIDVLANDSDVDGNLDPTSVSVVNGPANGAISVNPMTGIITYTKSGDFNGSDSFTYEVCDDGTPLPAECATATVSITIDPVNDPPVADANAVTTDEDTAVTITLTGSDIDGDPLTFAVATPPGNGSVGTITQLTQTSASVTYTPNTDFNGADSFTFTANDGTVDSAPAMISLTVNPINDPPTADSGAATTDEDLPVTITLTGGDIDADPLTFAIATGPANGSLSVITLINDTTAEVTYTPAADFNGTDSFTFSVNDGTVASAPATIALTVNPVNDPPVADAGTASTDEDIAVTITLNGSDVEGDALTFAIVTGPGNGALGAITQINDTSAEVTYTPATDFNGADSFTFTANDGTVDSAPATISLTVNPINDPPTADSGAATTDEDLPVTITLTGGDIDADPLTFAIATGPANGSLSVITLINDTTAEVTYTPAADFNGSDSFTFTTNDSTVDSAPATIALTVNPVNDPPAANDSTATTEEDVAVTITLTGSDIDGDPLTFAIAGGPTNGALGTITQINDTTAEVTYTPTTGFSGSDSFTYTASDGTVASAPATISITVTPGNAPPVANTAAPSTDEDAPVVITLTGSDADGDPLTFAIATGPGNGALSAITPVDATSAQVTYTPSANFFGSDNFTFTVNDGTDTSSAATVSLTVNAVNDPPTVVAHALTTHSAIRITLGAADSELLKDGAADVDDPSSALSVSPLAATSTNGAALTLIDAATGTYRYDPPGGFTGADSFTYEVCDSATSALPVQCATETVNVAVTGPALWIVDPAAPPGGNGSLTAPLQALSSLPGGRAAGGRVFLFAGNNSGGHSFVTNEHLIGQGATGNTFDGFLGVQVPVNGSLDTRPGVAGIRPVVGGQVTLAGGAIARGFNISTSGPTGLFGSGAFTGIDVQEMNVTSINGTAISLTGLTGEFTLGAVNASGGVNGIVLNNFGASGFFLVNGDGTNARNGSGGTIQNTTGDGVLMSNANNVTLASMRLINVGDNTDPAAGGDNLAGNDHAIQSTGGGDVVLSGVLIDSPAAGGWEAVDLGGVNRIDNNSRIENVNASNMQALEVRNTNTNMTSLTIDNSDFANQASTNGSSYVLIQGFGSSVMTVVVGNGSVFEQLFGNGLQANSVDTATVTVTVQDSTLRNAVDGTVGLGATGGLGGVFVAASQNATINYDINTNVFNDLGRPLANAGTITLQGIGGTGKTLDGKFDLNDIARIGYPTAAAATGTSTVGHRVIDIVTENNIARLDHESDTNTVDDTSREAFFVSSRDDSQDFDISITNNALGQAIPIGSTNREAIEILSEDVSDMEIVIMNNAIAGNTSFDQVVDIDTENTSFMDIHFINNTVTNADVGREITVDTENGTSTHCMAFTGNTAVDVEFDVNASPNGHQIEDFGSIAANNPGVTNFIDGAGVTSVAANTCQLPDF